MSLVSCKISARIFTKWFTISHFPYHRVKLSTNGLRLVKLLSKTKFLISTFAASIVPFTLIMTLPKSRFSYIIFFTSFLRLWLRKSNERITTVGSKLFFVGQCPLSDLHAMGRNSMWHFWISHEICLNQYMYLILRFLVSSESSPDQLSLVSLLPLVKQLKEASDRQTILFHRFSRELSSASNTRGASRLNELHYVSMYRT